jgi:hypothetical protein
MKKVASTDSQKEQKAPCLDEHIGEETGICTRQTFSGKKVEVERAKVRHRPPSAKRQRAGIQLSTHGD